MLGDRRDTPMSHARDISDTFVRFASLTTPVLWLRLKERRKKRGELAVQALSAAQRDAHEASSSNLAASRFATYPWFRFTEMRSPVIPARFSFFLRLLTCTSTLRSIGVHSRPHAI